jgi:hypothetical protein
LNLSHPLEGAERLLSPAPHNFRQGVYRQGDPVRRGDRSERFELRHGDCGGSDCKNPRARAEIELTDGLGREAIGQGSLFSGAERLIGGDTVVTGLLLFPAQHGLILAVLPPGAFILLGLLLALCKPERRHERVDHKTDASPGTTPDTTPIKAPEPQAPTS